MPFTSKHPRLLLLDWDGTLTTSSTVPLIASITTLPKIHPGLESLSAAYSEDLRRHNESYIPLDRKTIQQELAYLESLRTVEKSSIERLERSGILKDVDPSSIEVAANKSCEEGSITLRAGWERLIGLAQGHPDGGKAAIISVAWSRRFISSVLGEWTRNTRNHQIDWEIITVKANEIMNDGSGRLDRYWQGQGIWTATDKLRAMMEKIYGATITVDAGRIKPFTIYVGDSPTDLACLLKADVGICIRDKPLTSEQEALREILERLNVECAPIEDRSRVTYERSNNETKRGKLWWAKDFNSICESGILDEDS